jgi:predicted cupin superfamily sugar epimerase
VPTSYDPANDSKVDEFTGVTIAFDGTVSVAQSHPKVELREGPLTAGVPTGAAVSVTDWMAVINSGEQPRLFPCDDDYNVEVIKMLPNTEYYLTIPEGVFKNSDGTTSERVVLHYTGNYIEPSFDPTAITPEADSKIASFENVQLTFESNPTIVSSTYLSAKIIKGELVNGVPTGEELGGYDQWWANASGKTVTLFPGDEYDGYTMPVNFEKGADYYVVIPAKSFRSSLYLYNKEIILHYVGDYEKPAFSPVSTNPASDSEVATFENVVLTFSENASLVGSTYLNTKIIKGELVDGVPTGEEVGGYDQWWANASGKTVTLFPGDEYDGFTSPINFEKGANYFVIIPANTFRNSAGTYNNEIVLHYVGNYEEPAFTPSSVSPSPDSKVATLENIILTFTEKPTTVGTTYLNTSFIKGKLVNGVPVGEDVTGFDQWWVNISNTKATLFPGDEYDGFTMPVNLEKDEDYYIVIPARTFRNSSGVYNKEIVLHYVGNYEAPAFEPISFSPASDSEVTTFENVVLTFNENASLVGSTYLKTKIIKGSLVNGVPTGEEVGGYDQWWANASGKTVTLFPGDEYDGFTSPINFSEGSDYYVVIPAETFKNSSGNVNKEIILHYVGKYELPKFNYTEVDPAAETHQETLGTFVLTFSEKVSLNGKVYEGSKILKSDAENGTELKDHYDIWWAYVSGNKATLFTGDEYDGFTMPLTTSKDEEYYIVIPEKAFKNSAGTYSDKIILHYTSEGSGVNAISVANGVEVVGTSIIVNAKSADIYSTAGVLVRHIEGSSVVDGLSHGIYIIRAIIDNEVKTFKVSL